MPTTKIATCTYCGTRAALVLKGQAKHELACSSCGAPLHDLKRLRSDAVDAKAHRAPQKGRKGHRDVPSGAADLMAMALRKPRKKLKKRKKSLLGEAFDLIEDIFD